MTDSFRSLCAELTDKLHQYAETFPEHDVAPLVQRARDLLDLDEPEGEALNAVEYPLALELRKARAVEAAVLARRPTPPPPADGEVAELVRYLKQESEEMDYQYEHEPSRKFRRTAELLQRFAAPACLVVNPSPEAAATLLPAGPGRIELLPDGMQIIEPAEHTLLVPVLQPVPVAERLPGPEDLDVEGTCWVWNFTAYTWGLFRLDLTAHSHWLPANALPVPTSEEVGE